MELKIHNIDEITIKAKEFLQLCIDKKIFVFNAPMGSGKTTFILQILSELGVEELEGSPTYSLVNEYELPNHELAYHFDLYRLNSLEEALDIGIEDIIYNNSYCFIEWPEKIEKILPADTVYVTISVDENNCRIIDIKHEN